MALDMDKWAWANRAACKGMDLVAFFGRDAERGPDKETREAAAKAICSRCLVRTDCLDSALANVEKGGIFGGLTEDERFSERRRRQRRANAA